jgi:hypothetical protein
MSQKPKIDFSMTYDKAPPQIGQKQAPEREDGLTGRP